MADVKIIPRVRCDNCSVTAEKELDLFKKDYERPRAWGQLNLTPANYGSQYPDHVRMNDLCPACLRALHNAVGEALRARRKEEGIDT